jgi:hypothetical protein
MVADLVKDLKEDQINYLLINYNITRSDAKYIVDNYRDTYTQDLIAKAMDVYGLNIRNAEEFVDNYPNESAWADVEEVADSLGVDVSDVDDDDVENYMSMGGNKGNMESSVGPIQWIYDNKAKTYIVYMIVETMGEPRDVIYNIDPNTMQEWLNSESMGEYWNEFVRSNKDIEEAANSEEFPPGGCNANILDPSIVRRFNTRFVAIS